jgi:hypothetical protein
MIAVSPCARELRALTFDVKHLLHCRSTIL